MRYTVGVIIIAFAVCLLLLLSAVIATYVTSVTEQSVDLVSNVPSGPIALVQGNAKGYSGAYNDAIFLSMTATPVKGNVLVAVIGTNAAYMNGEFSAVSGIHQTGVTWSKKAGSTYQDGTSYLNTEIWAGIVGSSASKDIVIDLSPEPSFSGVANVCEYSGISGVVDKTASTGGSGSVASTGTTPVTTQSKELWVGGITNYKTTQTTPTTGFTLFDGATQDHLAVSYLQKIVTSKGEAFSGTTIGGGDPWAGCIVTFLPGAPPLGSGAGSIIFCGQLGNGSYYIDNGGYTYGTSASNMLNTAITQASATGNGNVIVLNGTWTLKASLVPKSNVNFTCQPGVIITENTPTSLGDSIALMLSTDGVNNFIVNGGEWDARKGSLSDFRLTGTWFANFYKYFGIAIYSDTPSTNITIKNVLLKNVIGQGIDLFNCRDALIQNCTVINAGDNPITLDEKCTNSVIEYCTVVGGQDVGINTWAASNCTLQFNKVSDVTQYSGASHWGIAAEASKNINILNNTVYGCDYNIVSTSENTFIYGNTVDGKRFSEFGIELQESKNTVVSYNTVTGCANAFGTYEPWKQTANVTLQGNVGFGSEYVTLSLTILGNGKVSASSSWCNYGLVSVNGANYQFPVGSTVVLTATESSFRQFSLNGTSSTNNQLSILMDSNKVVTVSFT